MTPEQRRDFLAFSYLRNKARVVVLLPQSKFGNRKKKGWLMYNDFSRGHNDATKSQLEAEEVVKTLGLMVIMLGLYVVMFKQNKSKTFYGYIQTKKK
jgi:hypothetical protein